MNSLLLSVILFSYSQNLELSEYKPEYDNSDTFKIRDIEKNEVFQIPLTMYRSYFVQDYKVHLDTMLLHKVNIDSTRFHNDRIYYKLEFFSLPESLIATSVKKLILINVTPVYGINAAFYISNERTWNFISEETDSLQSMFRILRFGDIIETVDCKNIDLFSLVYFDTYWHWDNSVDVFKIRNENYIKYGQKSSRFQRVLRKKKGKIVIKIIYNYLPVRLIDKVLPLRRKKDKTVYRC